MGRKKGSKNKLKAVENLKSDGLPDGVFLLDGSDTRPPGYAIDIEKCPYRDPKKMIAQLPGLPKIPIDYPSNWNEMGKVQKLEWLTANPRK